MATFTPRLNLAKPVVDGDEDVWGGMLNGNTDIIDNLLKATGDTATGLIQFDKGLSWGTNTGGFGAGSISADPNWGGYIRGRVGGIADLALVSGANVRALSVMPNATMQVGKGFLFSPAGASITWGAGGSQPPNTLMAANANWTGDGTGAGGPAGGAALFQAFRCADDSITGATVIQGVGVELAVRNSIATGHRLAGQYQVILEGDTHINNTIAFGATVTANSWQGGTGPLASQVFGMHEAMSLVINSSSAGKYMANSVALEIGIKSSNTTLAEGPANRGGIIVAACPYNFSTTENGTMGRIMDYGYLAQYLHPVGNNNPAYGWMHGFAVGAGHKTIHDLGAAFGVIPSGEGYRDYEHLNTMGYVLKAIDAKPLIAAIATPGFRLMPFGEIVSGIARMYSAGANFVIDVSSWVGPVIGTTYTGANLSAGSTTGYLVGQMLTDVFSGRHVVTTIGAGGVITGIKTVVQGMSTADRTGAVTLAPSAHAAFIGAAGTCTVQQTWTTGALLQLNPTGAPITAGGVIQAEGGVNASSLYASTGGIQVGTATDNGYFQIYGPAGSTRQIRWHTGTSATPRWAVGMSTGAESGANAGADWAVNRYADAGTLLGTPLLINRATGAITLVGDALGGVLVGGTALGGKTRFEFNPTNPGASGAALFMNRVGTTAGTDGPQINSFVRVDHSGGSQYRHLRVQTDVTGNPGGGANSGVWSILNQLTTRANDVGGGNVLNYNQAIRVGVNAGGTRGASLWSGIFEARSQTGLASSAEGIIQSVEVDLFANGLDDLSPAIGRTAISVVIGKDNASGANLEVTNGISFYGAGSGAAYYKRMISAAAEYSQAVLDTRTAVPLSAAAHAIWLNTSDRIALDASATVRLSSNGTTFLVNVGGTDRFSISSTVFGMGLPVSVTGAISGTTNINAGAALTAGTFVLAGTATVAGNITTNGPAASPRQQRWQTAGLARWAVGMDTAAETGTETGAGFAISRFNDAGTNIGTTFFLERVNGRARFEAGVGMWNAAAPTSKPAVTGAKGSNAALASLIAALVSYGIVSDSTTA